MLARQEYSKQQNINADIKIASVHKGTISIHRRVYIMRLKKNGFCGIIFLILVIARFYMKRMIENARQSYLLSLELVFTALRIKRR